MQETDILRQKQTGRQKETKRETRREQETDRQTGRDRQRERQRDRAVWDFYQLKKTFCINFVLVCHRTGQSHLCASCTKSAILHVFFLLFENIVLFFHKKGNHFLIKIDSHTQAPQCSKSLNHCFHQSRT